MRKTGPTITLNNVNCQININDYCSSFVPFYRVCCVLTWWPKRFVFAESKQFLTFLFQFHFVVRTVRRATELIASLAQIPLGSSRLDTFDVSSPCILPASSLSNSTDRHAQHDELGSTRNLVFCVICIKL